MTDDDGLIGEIVGSYRITELIGQGGMGRVYKAEHPTIGSRVAIKVLGGSISDPRAVKRFFDEARAVNLIHHENIVDVLDLAMLPDGRPYILMEYLEGVSLAQLIHSERRLPPQRAARIVSEVLAALEAAHRRGIVHRDIKPENIFVTAGGRVKVLDFGVAKLAPSAAGGAPSTATTGMVGTPHYMSPEQAKNLPVDARTDIYAVGLVLYEAVSGRKAFDADSMYELLRMHVEQTPPPPCSLGAPLSQAFEQVIQRALEKRPEDRYASAADFGEALASVSDVGGVPHAVIASTPPVSPRGPTTPVPFVDSNAPTLPDKAVVSRTLREEGRRSSRWLAWFAAGALVLAVATWQLIEWRSRDATEPLAPGSQTAATATASAVVSGSAAASGSAAVLGSAPSAVPQTIDRKHFELRSYLPQAMRSARDQGIDPVLAFMNVHGMGADGIADLTQMTHSAAFTFLDKSSERCVMVNVSQTTQLVMEGLPVQCAGVKRVGLPRCSARQVMDKALSNIEVKGTHVGTLTFTMGPKGPAWSLNMGPIRIRVIADDC